MWAVFVAVNGTWKTALTNTRNGNNVKANNEVGFQTSFFG